LPLTKVRSTCNKRRNKLFAFERRTNNHMPSPDWYPTREDELFAWHSQFAASLASYAATLTIPAGTVTQAQTNADMVGEVLAFLAAAQNFGTEVVDYKNGVFRGLLNDPIPPVPTVPAVIVPPAGAIGGIEAYTRQLAAQIKANSAFTEQMGSDMGITSKPAEVGTPSIQATPLTQSQVQLNVFKAGYDVIAVDSLRGGGQWEQIHLLTSAQIVDNRPPLIAGMPEQRQYRCQGYDNNQRVGALSGIVTVVTNP
jgi:hypothetical protein